MNTDGPALTAGGIIGHADGEPGLVAFKTDGRLLPLSVHYQTGAWTVIVCWRCGDTRKFEGAWCPSCRPAPSHPSE